MHTHRGFLIPICKLVEIEVFNNRITRLLHKTNSLLLCPEYGVKLLKNTQTACGKTEKERNNDRNCK